MATTLPADRVQISELASRQYAAMFRLTTAVELDPQLRELVDVRISQLTGCAFCLDMRWKDARAVSEREERLYMLDGWRESALFSERERVGLELAEAMTLIAQDHMPDAVCGRVQSAFDAREAARLVFAITVVNAWSRLLITPRAQAGIYEPGMFVTREAR
jgi:AhpD family alkylhydroperoxidase